MDFDMVLHMFNTLIHFSLVLKSYVHPPVNSLGKVRGEDQKKASSLLFTSILILLDFSHFTSKTRGKGLLLKNMQLKLFHGHANRHTHLSSTANSKPKNAALKILQLIANAFLCPVVTKLAYHNYKIHEKESLKNIRFCLHFVCML